MCSSDLTQIKVLDEEATEAFMWATTNSMTFSAGKSVLVQFGKVNFDYEIHLGSERIEKQMQAPDLGVIVDSKLAFRQHLRKIKKKAGHSRFMFRTTFRTRDKEVLATYHRTHYKPIILYASQVWMKYDKVTFDTLESLDRQFWRISPETKIGRAHV